MPQTKQNIRLIRYNFLAFEDSKLPLVFIANVMIVNASVYQTILESDILSRLSATYFGTLQSRQSFRTLEQFGT